jgi:hypothetical protein
MLLLAMVLMLELLVGVLFREYANDVGSDVVRYLHVLFRCCLVKYLCNEMGIKRDVRRCREI